MFRASTFEVCLRYILVLYRGAEGKREEVRGCEFVFYRSNKRF